MDIRIIGEHLEISNSFEDYLKNKLNHSHIPEEMQTIEFRLGNYGKMKKHLKVKTKLNHRDIIVDVTADSTYHAADKLMKVFNHLLEMQKKKQLKKPNYIIKDFKHHNFMLE